MKLTFIVGISLAACFFGGYEWGRVHEKAERAKLDASALLTRVVENTRKAEDQAATNLVIKKDYASEAQAAITLRAAADGVSLRLPRSVCGPARPAQAESAGRGDATAAGTGVLPEVAAADPVGQAEDEGVPLPADIAAELKDKALEADLIAASCRGAQTFIEKNGMAP